MTFIKFTNIHGKPVLVNTEEILGVEDVKDDYNVPNAQLVVLKRRDIRSFVVTESLDEIAVMLNRITQVAKVEQEKGNTPIWVFSKYQDRVHQYKVVSLKTEHDRLSEEGWHLLCHQYI